MRLIDRTLMATQEQRLASEATRSIAGSSSPGSSPRGEPHADVGSARALMASAEPAKQTRQKTLVPFEVLTAGLPAPAFVRNQLIKRPRLRRLFLWPYLHRPGALPSKSVALLVDGVGARGVLSTARAVGRLRPGQWLTQVSCPMLAIGADHDAISPLTELAEFAESVPSARTVVLEGTGHMVMLERASAFTAEVVNFAKQPKQAL